MQKFKVPMESTITFILLIKI